MEGRNYVQLLFVGQVLGVFVVILEFVVMFDQVYVECVYGGVFFVVVVFGYDDGGGNVEVVC